MKNPKIKRIAQQGYAYLNLPMTNPKSIYNGYRMIFKFSSGIWLYFYHPTNTDKQIAVGVHEVLTVKPN